MATVEIYTVRGCGFCSRALALLRERGARFEEHDVTFDPEATAEVRGRTGQGTFPQVFLDGEFIGGCQELYALDSTGALADRLAAPSPTSD